MDQNALGQSDSRIFQTVPLEPNDEIAWFFACWYKFMEITSRLKNIGESMIKNGCGHCGPRTLKLAVSKEGINGINWLKFTVSPQGNLK